MAAATLRVAARRKGGIPPVVGALWRSNRHRSMIPCAFLVVVAVALSYAGAPAAAADAAAAASPESATDAVDALWASRALRVREAVRHAWTGYRTYAAGFDDLRPLSRGGLNWLNAHATHVDSLDTLLLVGLRDEYDEAVDEVLDGTVPLSTGLAVPSNTFEYELRVVGGLAGAFALSGDARLLDAARVAADAVLDHLDAGSRLLKPKGRIVPAVQPLHWALARAMDRVEDAVDPRMCASLAGITTFGLTFRFLARETGERRYLEAANYGLATVSSRWARADNGTRSKRLPVMQYQVQGSPESWDGDSACSHGFGAIRHLSSGGDSFYEALAKEQLLQGVDAVAASAGDVGANFTWPPAHELDKPAAYPYRGALRTMYDWLAAGLSSHGFERVTRWPPREDAQLKAPLPGSVPMSGGSAYTFTGQHLACYLPGVLALGARYLEGHEGDLQLAEELMRGCIDYYTVAEHFNAVGLGGDTNMVEPSAGTLARAKVYNVTEGDEYQLRPEAVEAAFVLYRVTGNEEYREFGWRVFESIERYARVESGGYAGIRDVSVDAGVPENGVDDMPSFAIAETFKYLYLLFEPREVLPLDEWVFTTEAHPLSIRARCSSSSGDSAAPIDATDIGWVKGQRPPPCGAPLASGRWSLAPLPWEPALLVVVAACIALLRRRTSGRCCACASRALGRCGSGSSAALTALPLFRKDARHQA